jgi:hypothetical protein
MKKKHWLFIGAMGQVFLGCELRPRFAFPPSTWEVHETFNPSRVECKHCLKYMSKMPHRTFRQAITEAKKAYPNLSIDNFAPA